MGKSKKKKIPYNPRPHTLRVPKKLQRLHELIEWYYIKAHSDMGVVSNWESMMSVLVNHCDPVPETAEDQLIEALDRKKSHDQILRATTKYRKVYHYLNQLPSPYRAFLDQLYYEKQHDDSLEGLLCRATHIIATSPSEWGAPDNPSKCVRTHTRALLAARKRVETQYVAILSLLDASLT